MYRLSNVTVTIVLAPYFLIRVSTYTGPRLLDIVRTSVLPGDMYSYSITLVYIVATVLRTMVGKENPDNLCICMNVHTVHTQYTHTVYTCTQYTHTVHTQYTHTVHTQYTHTVHTQYTQSIHTQYTHSTHTQYTHTVHTHSTHTVHTHSTHTVHTEYTHTVHTH